MKSISDDLWGASGPVVLAFTGHRPTKLGGYDDRNPLALWVQSEMRAMVERLRPSTIISGMALGVDTWAAELAIALKIPFIAAVPFKGQELAWRDVRQRDRYHRLLRAACKVEIVSPGGYHVEKMNSRNAWMVDNATLVCAVYDGSPKGGTYNCVKYARKVNKPIVYIDPKAYVGA